jgi:dihydroorotase
VAKREEHRLALCAAATSGDHRFFLGSDSAPHLDDLKEAACGCAGCFTATNTMPLLAHIFEQNGALSKLEGFSSRHGAAFYGLPVNSGQLILEKTKEPVSFPKSLPTPQGDVTVFDPGVAIHWHVAEQSNP